MTEAQQLLTQLIESFNGQEIEGIGEPEELPNGNIAVSFQDGNNVFLAEINPETGEITY
jgi:hypothetical protein